MTKRLYEPLNDAKERTHEAQRAYEQCGCPRLQCEHYKLLKYALHVEAERRLELRLHRKSEGQVMNLYTALLGLFRKKP